MTSSTVRPRTRSAICGASLTVDRVERGRRSGLLAVAEPLCTSIDVAAAVGDERAEPRAAARAGNPGDAAAAPTDVVPWVDGELAALDLLVPDLVDCGEVAAGPLRLCGCWPGASGRWGAMCRGAVPGDDDHGAVVLPRRGTVRLEPRTVVPSACSLDLPAGCGTVPSTSMRRPGARRCGRTRCPPARTGTPSRPATRTRRRTARRAASRPCCRNGGPLKWLCTMIACLSFDAPALDHVPSSIESPAAPTDFFIYVLGLLRPSGQRPLNTAVALLGYAGPDASL